MSNKPLIILGASANLLTYVETAEKQGLVIAGVIDSDYYQNKDSVHGIPVIGTETNLNCWNLNDYCFFIGSNWSPHKDHTRDKSKRDNFINFAKTNSLHLVNLIDTSAVVSKYSTLGSGIFIGANTVIEPNCSIDNYVQIFYNTNISYGSSLGENSAIQNNSTLVAHIGKNTFVGMNTKIFPYFSPGYVKIGDNVFVYPNLSVHENLENNCVLSN